MNSLLLSLVLLAATTPSSSTSWMAPDAFRLTVGMPRTSVLRELSRSGWNWKKGKVVDEIFLTYEEGKTLTLAFGRGRLRSLRFELVGFIPQIRAAFSERTAVLDQKLGEPRRISSSILSYERRSPNVMLVSSTDSSSSYGKQGLGYLVVRYFEPAR
ncbi:MAG TPA: hypothetical protein VNM92_01925 [Thermoanaerobaculia bacterium]|nr:hypothetical protein [Thermoanaerobaculia bacterium]